ncbi:MAG: hypothetical protein FJZ92_04030 [Chloroflexi bacterium]|nr:hypothetical protein [Chloroflexota bacterium]
MDGAALLERHNPVLVIFPQEFEGRRRPGSWRPGPRGWGDYHPCSVEFFLARVEQRDHPRAWSFRPRSLLNSILPSAWTPASRTGYDRLRALTARAMPAATASWELDVADLPSQDESVAWREYRRLLTEAEHAYEPVAYGRFVETPSGGALQYWYLYLYNDFRNNHEGDWEMVTIEFDAQGSPVRAGYSSHRSGLQRPWAEVPRAEPGGARPLLYVSRGSHAGSFGYHPHGHPVIGFSPSANPPFRLRALWSKVMRVPGIRRWKDFPPADPEGDVARVPEHLGTRVSPRLLVFPGAEPSPDGEWWWMRLRCRWGSTHTRFSGTVGPGSPWVGGLLDPRWRDPLGWLGHVKSDARGQAAVRGA